MAPMTERQRRIDVARAGIAMIEARYDSGARPPAVQAVVESLRREIEGLSHE